MAYDPFNSHSLNSSVRNIEPRNPHFVGRETELTRLQNILAQKTFCILGGELGVGTTALAVEYAHRFAHEYEGGRWQMLSDRGENLSATVAAVGSALRAAQHSRLKSETQRCLLVLDDVVQPELLRLVRELFAKGLDWLHVIATTQLKEEKVFGSQQNQSFLRIEGLPQGDVLALMESFQPNQSFASADHQRAADELASLLDGFTLPAAVAAASISYFGSSATLPIFVARLSQLPKLEFFDPRNELAKTIRQDESLTDILWFILSRLSKPATFALWYAAFAGEQFELAKIREFLVREFGKIDQGTDRDQQIRWQILISDFFKLQLWQSTNGLDAQGELRTARMHPLVRLNFKKIFRSEIERSSVEAVGGGEFVGITGNERSQAPHPLDENVMFTVYRRKTIAPNKWYPLLAFAHLSERRPDAPPDEPDPVVEVKRQAQALLGSAISEYKESNEDSSQAIPRSGELTFKPSVPGIEFNPPRRTFKWEEPVHREEFKMRATKDLEGQVARGCLRVFLGPIIVAEVNLAFKVDSNAAASAIAPELMDHARPFRKVFASYSHKDKAIVEEIEKMARGTHLGFEYLRDVTKLRSGDVWNDSLLQMIDTADLFQLFWSSNSMDSPYVKREYERALARQLKDFVRPVYWEKPFPERPEQNLPPEALKCLHFVDISMGEAVRAVERTRGVTDATYCKRCGRKFDVDAKFCLSCGSSRNPADTAIDPGSTGAVGTLEPAQVVVPPAARYGNDFPASLPSRASEDKSEHSHGRISSPIATHVLAIMGLMVFGLLLSALIYVLFLVFSYYGVVPLLIGCLIVFAIGLIIRWIRDPVERL